MIKHWTPEEENTLVELKSKGFKYREIAEVLNRTSQAVSTRGKRLIAQGRLESTESRGNFSWTEEEINKLYEELDYDELAEVLGKSRRAIQSKCEKLGVSKRFPGKKSGTGTMDPNKSTLLYLVDFGEFKKVGVTQVPLSERFKQDGEFILLDSCELSLEEAMDTEREILRNMRTFRVVGSVRRGSLECFKHPCTQLEEII
jgi:hypothetical protein